MEGLANGHYDDLDRPWQRIAHTQPLGHCEGEKKKKRMDFLITLREESQPQPRTFAQPIYRSLVRQPGHARKVIAAFARHPHRNHIPVGNPHPLNRIHRLRGVSPIAGMCQA